MVPRNSGTRILSGVFVLPAPWCQLLHRVTPHRWLNVVFELLCEMVLKCILKNETKKKPDSCPEHSIFSKLEVCDAYSYRAYATHGGVSFVRSFVCLFACLFVCFVFFPAAVLRSMTIFVSIKTSSLFMKSCHVSTALQGERNDRMVNQEQKYYQVCFCLLLIIIMLERRLFCVRWWVLTAAIITMQQLLFFPREGLTCTRVYVGIGASRAAWAK